MKQYSPQKLVRLGVVFIPVLLSLIIVCVTIPAFAQQGWLVRWQEYVQERDAIYPTKWTYRYVMTTSPEMLMFLYPMISNPNNPCRRFIRDSKLGWIQLEFIGWDDSSGFYSPTTKMLISK